MIEEPRQFGVRLDTPQASQSGLQSGRRLEGHLDLDLELAGIYIARFGRNDMEGIYHHVSSPTRYLLDGT